MNIGSFDGDCYASNRCLSSADTTGQKLLLVPKSCLRVAEKPLPLLTEGKGDSLGYRGHKHEQTL